MVQDGGFYYVIGYGENINVPTIDIISREISFIGNLVGTYIDLQDLMTLTAQGKVTLHTCSTRSTPSMTRWPTWTTDGCRAAASSSRPRRSDTRMGKRLYFNHEARLLLQAGVDELANTVKVTLGPEGAQRRAGAARRRADDHQRRRHDRARDRAHQPVQEHGRAARARGRQQDVRPDRATARRRRRCSRRRSCAKACARSTRARTRCCCERGIEEAHRAPSSAELQRVARPVEGRDELEHVATIAAKEDEVIGASSPRRSTASAPRASSRSRRPTSPASPSRFVEGMVVENGWLSPYMVRDPHRMETVFENPLVLMTNKPIKHPNDLLPILDAVMQEPAAAGHPGRDGRGRRARACSSPTTSTGRSRPSRCARPASATGASSTSATSPRSAAAR